MQDLGVGSLPGGMGRNSLRQRSRTGGRESGPRSRTGPRPRPHPRSPATAPGACLLGSNERPKAVAPGVPVKTGVRSAHSCEELKGMPEGSGEREAAREEVC